MIRWEANSRQAHAESRVKESIREGNPGQKNVLDRTPINTKCDVSDRVCGSKVDIKRGGSSSVKLVRQNLSEI